MISIRFLADFLSFLGRIFAVIQGYAPGGSIQEQGRGRCAAYCDCQGRRCPLPHGDAMPEPYLARGCGPPYLAGPARSGRSRRVLCRRPVARTVTRRGRPAAMRTRSIPAGESLTSIFREAPAGRAKRDPPMTIRRCFPCPPAPLPSVGWLTVRLSLPMHGAEARQLMNTIAALRLSRTRSSLSRPLGAISVSGEGGSDVSPESNAASTS